jgi:Ca-activated chloride channel family protein
MKRRLLVPGFTLLLVVSQLVAQQPQQEQPGPEATFKVDVRLVNVFVTVTDEHGAPVGNLNKDQFRLFEDGVPQQISVFSRESQLPLSIVLEIDVSSSTRRDLPLELEAARRFVHSILRKQDRLSLYQFNQAVTELTPFTSDLDRIDRGIHRVTVGGATALYDAVYLGSDSLLNRQGRKVLVLITDGGDTVSTIDYHEALRAAQQSEALVYSIIVVPVESSAGRNTGGEHALIQISTDTGGKYYYASNLAEVEKAFGQISDELRTQYLLAYYPNQRVASSDFREIEVNVRAPATPGTASVAPAATTSPTAGDPDKSNEHTFLVRHRKGYYTSKLH